MTISIIRYLRSLVLQQRINTLSLLNLKTMKNVFTNHTHAATPVACVSIKDYAPLSEQSSIEIFNVGML